MENRVGVVMGTEVGFRSRMWIRGWMPRTLAGIVSPQRLSGDDAQAGNRCLVFVGVGREADWVPWHCGQLGLVRINLGVLRNVTLAPSLTRQLMGWMCQSH